MKYHDKRYPHTVCVRLSEKEYNKLTKHNITASEIIRNLINNTLQ